MNTVVVGFLPITLSFLTIDVAFVSNQGTLFPLVQKKQAQNVVLLHIESLYVYFCFSFQSFAVLLIFSVD